MGKEAEHPLADARKLLADLNGESIQSKASPPDLEETSRRLLRAFVDSADCRFFNAFYHLSRGAFCAYTVNHTRRFHVQIDAEDVLNRLYILLFEKLLDPQAKVPLDYLFPWCYRVLYNFVREENRALRKVRPQTSHVAETATSRSVLDDFVDRERASLDKLRWERVLELLHSDDREISSRDRLVMRMFYLEGHSIRAIGERLDLSKANVGVILMRTRRRIAQRISREEKSDENRRDTGLSAG